MITVTLTEGVYTLPSADDALASLTGKESVRVEDYLGGFENFGRQVARSTVVTVWLALRAAGQPRTFDEIEQIPGLVFGGIVTDDGEGEPEDPMVDPGRPLAGRNEPNGSEDGTSDSPASPETSGSTTSPHSTVSTG